MAEVKKPITRKRVRSSETGHTNKRRTRRPLGLGQMAQRDFPFVAVVNGETMIVDRMGPKVIFTPWI